MRDQADVENVVLSAYKSFFLRNQRGEFDLADWDELWSLLAMITLRKCTKRRKHLRAARRDAGREVPLAGAERTARAWLPDRAPTPDEAAILTETVETLFQAMTPDDRPIVEQILHGLHGPGGGRCGSAARSARSAACASVPSADSSGWPILRSRLGQIDNDGIRSGV